MWNGLLGAEPHRRGSAHAEGAAGAAGSVQVGRRSAAFAGGSQVRLAARQTASGRPLRAEPHMARPSACGRGRWARSRTDAA